MGICNKGLAGVTTAYKERTLTEPVKVLGRDDLCLMGSSKCVVWWNEGDVSPAQHRTPPQMSLGDWDSSGPRDQLIWDNATPRALVDNNQEMEMEMRFTYVVESPLRKCVCGYCTYCVYSK